MYSANLSAGTLLAPWTIKDVAESCQGHPCSLKYFKQSNCTFSAANTDACEVHGHPCSLRYRKQSNALWRRHMQEPKNSRDILGSAEIVRRPNVRRVQPRLTSVNPTRILGLSSCTSSQYAHYRLLAFFAPPCNLIIVSILRKPLLFQIGRAHV